MNQVVRARDLRVGDVVAAPHGTTMIEQVIHRPWLYQGVTQLHDVELLYLGGGHEHLPGEQEIIIVVEG